MTVVDIKEAVFETAADIACEKGLTRREARNCAADHLRYAALKLIEGHPSTHHFCEAGRFTVAYGDDMCQYDSWGEDVDWWEEANPMWNAHRVRVFSRDESTIAPQACRILEAIGATFVFHEQPDSGQRMGDDVYHFLMPNESDAVSAYRDYVSGVEYSEQRPAIEE